MTDDSNRTITLKRSLDTNILGENISDIADFAVEKYEFRHNTTLSSETREAATEGAKVALWELVKQLQLKREQILKAFFEKADQAVNDVVSESQE
ncbi:MAG: hypothetical protein OXL40_07120 [Bacteroidota bacterium]|nr:hypothetical protein [Bacteroidota bacterium]